jgi:hypothetical protein
MHSSRRVLSCRCNARISLILLFPSVLAIPTRNHPPSPARTRPHASFRVQLYRQAPHMAQSELSFTGAFGLAKTSGERGCGGRHAYVTCMNVRICVQHRGVPAMPNIVHRAYKQLRSNRQTVQLRWLLSAQLQQKCSASETHSRKC